MPAGTALYAWGGFGAIALVFVYTTVANMIERPEGLKIGLLFVLAIFVVSFASRALRSTFS